MQFGDSSSLGSAVIAPLLGFSVLAVALIFERIIFWLRLVRRQNRLVRSFFDLYRRNPWSAFGQLKQNADLPIARIFLAALALENPTPEEFRLALESAAQAELPLLKRFNTVFETIISVAPLLGLLGTILGLMDAFAGLKLGDVAQTDTTGVSAGIGAALTTTALGLIVAIGTLLFANMFRGLYLRQIALIHEYGGQLELLYRRYHEQTDGGPYASS